MSSSRKCRECGIALVGKSPKAIFCCARQRNRNRMREWRQKNVIRYLKYQRDYRARLTTEQKNANKLRSKLWREVNKERRDQATREWRQRNPQWVIDYSKAYYRKNREKIRAAARERMKAMRSENKLIVIRAYGGRCSCCGETINAFLCLDHVHGGGHAHRKSVTDMWTWARKNNYPSTLQLLCYNCNAAKAILGYCPHESTD